MEEKAEILNDLYDKIGVYSTPGDYYTGIIMHVFENYETEEFQRVVEILINNREKRKESFCFDYPSFSEWRDAKKIHKEQYL